MGYFMSCREKGAGTVHLSAGKRGGSRGGSKVFVE